ncbi:MAG: transcriptional repressor LexA [Bradymonadales bacterium]|nr:transcriptional repressor LexA [Bradymonadales bacterium]
MKGLTPRQRLVLTAIASAMEERGYPPTIREIGDLLDIKSTNGVNDHLRALERKGYLYRDRSKSRAIRLVEGLDLHSFELGEELPGEQQPSEENNLVELPLLGRIAAGFPSLAEENREATFQIDAALLGSRARPEQMFLLKVHGDSMIGDGIMDGDLVFVERTHQPSPGEIVVALVDGEATVKRFYPQGDAIRLEPSNPAMKPIVVSARDGRNTAVIGRIVAVFRRVPSRTNGGPR